MQLRSLHFVYALLALSVHCVAASGASRAPVRARHGMVVSADSFASAVGVEVLRNGGNAVDAAVAVGFALAVTFPEAGNLGGGGFMLMRLANGFSTMVDFREKAPALATKDMFLDSAGNVVPQRSLVGPLAAGVPGTVAGLLYALAKYGTNSREETMRRAIEAADDGFIVSRRFALSLQTAAAVLDSFESTRKVFVPGGALLREGQLWRQPDLARALESIEEDGAAAFYKGWIATKIVQQMRRDGGIITLADLASYSVEERVPVTGRYHGYEVLSSSPPAAGGTVLLEMLNILERFDLRVKGHNSSAAVHLLAAAAQRAYADRAEFLGDPDFGGVPVAWLVSKDYAAAKAKEVDTLRATPSRAVRAAGSVRWKGSETTHYCVADAFGNVVATTVTLNDLYGCRVVVDGAGFLLNNEMDDFVAKPGAPNAFGLVGGEANSIAPGKRMLSSMTPTVVLRDGRPGIVLGARGGSRITTAVMQVIVNMLDFGMNVQEAVDAPRIHHQWLPDEILYEPRGFAQDVMVNLQRMGHVLTELEDHLNGKVQALSWSPVDSCFYGGADPREEGVAMGY